MKVFTTSAYYQRFVKPLCTSGTDVAAGRAEIKRFPNGEMHALVQDTVAGEECLVLGSAAPPDEQLLALLTLSDALNRSGAAKIHAFMPYLGYARQDKFGDGESGGIALIGSLFKAAGIKQVIAFDIHSHLDKELLQLPLRSLSPASTFAATISKIGWLDATIVAPDEGAIERARTLANTLGHTGPTPHLVKRHTNGIVHLNLTGAVGDKVILVDDILDTGRTLISACQILRDNEVHEIIVAVTHGLFTGDDWKQLFNLGVQTLYVSDSCPEATMQNHPKIRIVPFVLQMPEVIAATRRLAPKSH